MDTIFRQAPLYWSFYPKRNICVMSTQFQHESIMILGIHEQDAPYLLEPVGTSFADEAVPVRLALLAAVGKLFFKRPPECQRLLGTVLSAAMADANQDVHDRALLCYRCRPHDMRTLLGEQKEWSTVLDSVPL